MIYKYFKIKYSLKNKVNIKINRRFSSDFFKNNPSKN